MSATVMEENAEPLLKEVDRRRTFVGGCIDWLQQVRLQHETWPNSSSHFQDLTPPEHSSSFFLTRTVILLTDSFWNYGFLNTSHSMQNITLILQSVLNIIVKICIIPWHTIHQINACDKYSIMNAYSVFTL